MTNYEHTPSLPEKQLSSAEQQRLVHEGNERLRENHESNVEHAPEMTTPESAKHEVEKAYEKADKQQAETETRSNPGEKQSRKQTISRKTKEANFKRVMNDIQPQLSPTSRAFSKFIHNRTVEAASDTLGQTIARPNAILAGAVAAFVLTLAVYLIGHWFGYPLSGFESIGAFILGWVIGILYDFLRVMITGKKA